MINKVFYLYAFGALEIDVRIALAASRWRLELAERVRDGRLRHAMAPRRIVTHKSSVHFCKRRETSRIVSIHLETSGNKQKREARSNLDRARFPARHQTRPAPAF